MWWEMNKDLCVLCLKTLAADSMKPNKLKRETLCTPVTPISRLSFSKRNLMNTICRKTACINNKVQLASYKITYRISQGKKPHTIGEELILPTALDMVSVMIDEKSTAKLKSVPLSNDTAARWIYDISQDLEDHLIEKVRHPFCLAGG